MQLVTNYYISQSCTVSPAAIFCNGQQVLANADDAPATDFLLAAYKYLDAAYPKFYKMDKLAKTGWLAAEFLLRDAAWISAIDDKRKAIVLSNASASLDADIKYMDGARDLPSPAQFVYTLPNIVIGEISIKHHIKGENAFFVSDEFDAAFIHTYASYLLEHDLADACLCGWVELLNEQYKAVVYMVSREPGVLAQPFTPEQMNKIFFAVDQQHGQ